VTPDPRRLIRSYRLGCFLLPVACNPDPTTRTTYPVACHPNRGRSWPDYPTARHPDVVGSGPSPIAGRPHISWSGRHCLGFNANLWRSSCHQYLASWPGRCYFLRRRSRCYRRWFFRAADQRQRYQHHKVRASLHRTPPTTDSFCAKQAALSKIKASTRVR
jgi:hypothetical protein